MFKSILELCKAYLDFAYNKFGEENILIFYNNLNLKKPCLVNYQTKN